MAPSRSPTPWSRSAHQPIMVVVSQRPWAVLPCARFPRGARPRSRVRLVLGARFVEKDSAGRSKPLWRRRHARRARAMSGGLARWPGSVFFICQPHLSRRVVDGRERALQGDAARSSFKVRSGFLPSRARHLTLMRGPNHRLAPERSSRRRSRRCADAVARVSSPCPGHPVTMRNLFAGAPPSYRKKMGSFTRSSNQVQHEHSIPKRRPMAIDLFKMHLDVIPVVF